jgi:chromosome partitioning protein
MAARIVSFVNLKGGVGKTALAVNVGVSLAAELRQRVLIIDLDPQGNAGLWLLGQREWVETVNRRKAKTVYGMLAHNTPVGQCIVRSPVEVRDGRHVVETPDLIPATIHLMLFEEEHTRRDGEPPYYVRFFQEIEILKQQYEFIFLDCPPNIYKTTKCALFAADEIIVPCNTDALSWMGLHLLAQKIRTFSARTAAEFEQERPGEHPPLVSGLILNDVQTTASAVLDKSVQRLSTRLVNLRQRGLVREDARIFPATVRHSAALQRASFEFRPLLFSERPNKSLLADYRYLATLFVNRLGGRHGNTVDHVAANGSIPSPPS